MAMLFTPLLILKLIVPVDVDACKMSTSKSVLGALSQKMFIIELVDMTLAIRVLDLSVGTELT